MACLARRSPTMTSRVASRAAAGGSGGASRDSNAATRVSFESLPASARVGVPCELARDSAPEESAPLRETARLCERQRASPKKRAVTGDGAAREKAHLSRGAARPEKKAHREERAPRKANASTPPSVALDAGEHAPSSTRHDYKRTQADARRTRVLAEATHAMTLRFPHARTREAFRPHEVRRLQGKR